MKRLSAIVILLFSTSLALAQGSTVISAGIGIPQKPSDFSSYWETGLSVGIGIEVPVSDWLGLTIGFDFSSFPLNEEKFLEAQGVAGTGVSVSGGSATMLSVLGGAKVRVLHAPKLVSVYVVGLLGYLNFSTKEFEVTGGGLYGTLGGGERSSFCVAGGAGIELPIGKIADAFVEGRYVADFSASPTAFVPLRAGVKIRL